MISNSTELRVSARQLRIMEDTLNALRNQLQKTNPDLLEITAPAYVRRIALLQEEIAQYFSSHPSAVSLVLPRLDQMDEVVSSTELSAV